MIKLELTEDEAALFKSFREHQDVFKVMLDAKVFEISSGNFTVHLDKDKKVSLIDVHTFTRL